MKLEMSWSMIGGRYITQNDFYAFYQQIIFLQPGLREYSESTNFMGQVYCQNVNIITFILGISGKHCSLILHYHIVALDTMSNNLT